MTAGRDIHVHVGGGRTDTGAGARVVPPEPRAGLAPDPIQHFAGREDDLAWLYHQLQRRRRLAIHGLGGVGKTQLANQYLHHHRSDHADGSYWLRGDDPITMRADLASLAWHLRLPERELADQDLVIEAVFRWLRAHRDWLLVIDNVDEPAAVEALRGWLPGLPGCVLVTSRTPLWSGRLELEPLSEAVAARFLVERTKEKNEAAAAALAKRLGGLPLALEQAAAYLEATGETMAGYLRLLDGRSAELFAEGTPEHYPEPVATTWDVSFRRVEATSAVAADLLRLCSFLGSEDIPIELLASGAQAALPSDDLSKGLADVIARNRAIGVLRRYSLVRREGGFLSVHGLVQEVLRESLSLAGRHSGWAVRAVQVLVLAFPSEVWEPVAWADCRMLLPHALVAAELAGSADTEATGQVWIGSLLTRAAIYLRSQAAFEVARPLQERALAVYEKAKGPEHRDTATCLNNLAMVLHAQGELAAAQPMYERALAIRQKVQGPEHSDTATSLNNLAWLRYDQGELAAARPLYERALAVYEKAHGPEHPYTAQSLNNLALLFHAQGELAAARPLYERALAIREKVLGPDHPGTAQSLACLAGLLQAQGEPAARPLAERALAIWEKVLGPEHPNTASGLNNLAVVLHAQGELNAAQALYERALAINEKVLGPEHYDTATSLNQLARLLQARGELAAARPLYERALAIREKVLGPEHSDTASSRRALADL